MIVRIAHTFQKNVCNLTKQSESHSTSHDYIIASSIISMAVVSYSHAVEALTKRNHIHVSPSSHQATRHYNTTLVLHLLHLYYTSYSELLHLYYTSIFRARIQRSGGRVFAFPSHPHLYRVFQKNSNVPGLAVSRSIGTCLIH